jgi:hypothetical protein
VDKRVRGSMAERRTPNVDRRPSPLIIGGAVVALLAVAGVVGWLVWPDDRPDPRATVYTDRSACLLTPAAGVTDKDAAPVWAGMQQASQETKGKVSFLEVDGPQTAANASSYLGTLAAGKCDLVLVAGAAQVAALDERASSFPNVRFLAVGGAKDQANVDLVSAADAASTTDGVRVAVKDALSR